MSFVILDPTEQPAPEAASLQARGPGRLATLRGARVGLLANGKTNADQLLDAVGCLLEQRYGAVITVRENKHEASRPARAAILERFDNNVDLVLTAVGD